MATRRKARRSLRVALTGFSGLEDPGPGAGTAHALREGWGERIDLIAAAYGAPANAAWLPGVIDRLELLPPLAEGEQRLFDAWLDVHRRTPIDVLLPGEADVQPVARLAPRLAEAGIRTLLPPGHRVEALSRAHLGKFLHERQIASPLTIVVPGAHEVAALADRIGYPLSVRGVHFGEKVVHSAQQAHAEAQHLNGANQPGVTLQFQLGGERFSVGLVADEAGQVRALVTMKIVAANVEGRTVTGAIVELEHVERFATQFVKAAEWHGPLTLELVVPHGSLQPLLCDVRPHLPSWCRASHWGGTNLAVALLREITNARQRVRRPRAGTMFVRGVAEAPIALDDLLRLRQHRRLDGLPPASAGTATAPARRSRRSQEDGGITVAITGTSTYEVVNPGLGVARALRLAPEIRRIHGLPYGTLESGAYQSALFDEVFRLPDSGSLDALAYRIEEIHRSHPIDVLLPCLDGELPLFIALKPRLDALGIRTLLPDPEAFERRSKRQLFSGRLRSDWGEFSIPESRFARSEAETVKAVEAVGFPAVVKGPLFLCFPVQSRREAQWAWRQLTAYGWREAIVQRKIVGPYYATSVVCDVKHDVFTSFTLKKLTICQRGSTWSGVRVSEPRLERDFAAFLQRLKWTGPGEGEFVRDEVTDRFYLFEVNPRFTGWVYYTATLGCNQPALAVREALGAPRLPDPRADAPVDLAFVRQTADFPLRASQIAALATRGHLRNG
jgi:carbamoyl-phosphate synthase large subunit